MSVNDLVELECVVESDAAADGIGQRVRWHINRLRCMTFAEVLHRVLRALSMRAERFGLLGTGAVPAPDLTRITSSWVHPEPGVDATAYLAVADRVSAGRYDLFALRDIVLGTPPRWNHDTKTGTEAPLGFGKMLDYRDPQQVGNIKYLWELNRHLHIVTLAQAYVLSGDSKYFHAARKQLESWFADCPYRMGPNWSSALEAGIRLINWSIAWQLFGGANSPLFREQDGAHFQRRWLDSVFQHAQFIYGYFSLHSSANNHLIGEAAGLFVGALTWPHWPDANAWLADARTILEREVLLQNAADGVNREQSVSYQQFVLDLLLLPVLAARANGQQFSAAYESRVEAMLEYLASIMDSGGNVPMFGDADDALAVRFDVSEGFCAYRSLLATGALLFRRAAFKCKARTIDDKARWLFGKDAAETFRAMADDKAPLPPRRAFQYGGYYILGGDFDTKEEIRLIVDAGPLGYRSIAAHGHADALAFTLSLGGMEFLIDPGTYAYHGHRPWRDYFRGTGAHNTLRVDGKDQSESGGNFMWLKKANTTCSRWETATPLDIFEGWHDGYRRLHDPVTHRRRITLNKETRRILIEDCLEMEGTHDIELFFHCSEHCMVEPVQNGFIISQGPSTIKLALPQRPSAYSNLLIGSMAPISGWVSRRFDSKQPSPTITWRERIEGDCTLQVQIDY